MVTILETEDLTKAYGNFRALDQVTVRLEQGEIYGLIGRNGAGKTTFMRLIAGLSFPTKGKIRLFGQMVGKKPAANQKIGVMIENPAFIHQLTAKEVLCYFAKMRGLVYSDVQLNELLTKVHLADTGKKKAQQFSLGMKQRLGIAIALLGDPAFLVLDEPINGLDPQGVVEIRELLRLLATEGKTILLSSHNLPELYQVATQYIILNQGKVVKQLSLSELEKQTRQYLRVATNQPQRLAQVLSETAMIGNYEITRNGEAKLFQVKSKEKLLKQLIAGDVWPTTFVEQEESLENYYFSLIGGS
ncbi:ABC transporter ATP-binding protein [Enterococcus sp. AZ109]|uniref:ABC transporter ATP-binding protein n=1 Tax=Enterococcus sp. AZ109 TaxID=2774634 RepID=UPI003F1F115A